jgi:pimeloyl-ACP methyl ester carboxylesterase
MPTYSVGPVTLYAEQAGTGDRLLFISGTGGDLRNKPSQFERMASRIPGAELAVFEGGHLFLWQDPTAFERVIDFLGAAQ